MKWSTGEMDCKCRELEPLGNKTTTLVALKSSGRLSVWLYGYRHHEETFRNEDMIVDTLMDSSKFDEDLFIMLTGTLDINARQALEMCLS